jgi:hypothetical protein
LQLEHRLLVLAHLLLQAVDLHRGLAVGQLLLGFLPPPSDEEREKDCVYVCVYLDTRAEARVLLLQCVLAPNQSLLVDLQSPGQRRR